MSREDRVNLVRFRSGHHPRLKLWRTMIGLEEDPSCRLCGEEEETARHLWMECPAMEMDRRTQFLGRRMAELTQSPTRVQALLRIIFRRLV